MNIPYTSRRTCTCVALAIGFLCSPSLKAGEGLSLKRAEGLQGRGASPIGLSVRAGAKRPGLLGQLDLFRGVEVGEVTEKPAHEASLSVVEKTESVLKPRFGGLQLSLKENMSLVYLPGKLSRSNAATDTQGLYLLNNRNGFANWFVGMESNAYSNQSDNRRVSTSTQIGVILNLD